MATPATLMQIAFAGGFDESQRPEVLDPSASFTNIENCRQDARGGFSKRLGFETLGQTRLDGSLRSSATTVFDHKGLACAIGSIDGLGAGVDVYSEAASRFILAGRCSEVNYDIIDTQALSIGASTSSGGVLSSAVLDIARAGNYIAIAHYGIPGSGGAAMYVSVQDNAGNVVKPIERLVQTSVGESVIALASYSTYILAFVTDGGTANIAAWYIDTTSASTLNTGWVSMGNVATDHTTGTGLIAFSTESLSNRVALAYVNNSGGASQLTVKTFTTAGVVETATVNTNSTTPTSVCVEGSIADTLWVAWNETTSVRVIGLDADNLASTLAATATVMTLDTANVANIGLVSQPTAGAGIVISNDGNSDRMHWRGYTTSAATVTPSGSQATIYNLQIASRPFSVTSGSTARYYVLVHPDNTDSGTNAQKTLILADFTSSTTWLRAVAMVEPGLANQAATGGTLPHWVTDGSNSSTRLSPITVARSGVTKAARIVSFDFTATGQRPAAHASATYLGGGITQIFDGERVTEVSYLYSPSKPQTSLGGTGITGTFRYVAVYESIDASGNWVQSAVSEPSSSVSPANQTVTVTTRTLTCTARIENTTNDARERVAIYRTATGGEEPYYRLATVYSTPASELVTFADSTADATLTANALLYGTGNLPSTDGAGLDRMSPPGLRYLVSYNGMLVGARGSALWYSSQYVEGEAPWFNPVFTVALPETITALEVQDGTLYAFSRTGVYALNGEPPADNGSSGGLGTPRRLSIDVGATTWQTCPTNLGIFFVSHRGIELLTRGGQSVEFIGEGVQTTMSSYPTVNAITLDTRNGLVRIALQSATSSGLMVVYDLTLRAWISRDIIGTGATYYASSGAMIKVAGAYRYGILATPYVWYEKLTSENTGIGTYGDAGSQLIVQRVETAWFKPSGIQGRMLFNRALLLAKRHTPHGLKMFVAYDYNTTYQSAQQWTDTQITTIAAALPNMQVGHQGHNEGPVQAVRIKIEDVDPTVGSPGTRQGATWIGLTLDVTPEPGAYELPDTAV